MGKELELLQKMELTAENRQKLETLITEAKKTGKVSSKHLVETLDDVDATQAQTEQFYDILEQAGIEIDVSDVLDLIGSADMDNPTLSEMQAIEDEGLPEDLETPEALPEDVETAKLDDPVRMYLKEIGRIKLLSPEEEQEVARAMAEGDEKTGVQIVAKALEEPIRQIAANAGLDGSVILEKVRTSGKNGFGFDAYKEEYCDMIASGIVDPAKVTRSALENAASVSAMVLTTESLVADKPQPAAPAAPAPDMGGMGGMY